MSFNSGRDEADALPDCKTLLIALPPSAGLEAFQRASKLAGACEWTVLISSTSVYPDEDGEYSEASAIQRVSPHSGCLLDLEHLGSTLKPRPSFGQAASSDRAGIQANSFEGLWPVQPIP